MIKCSMCGQRFNKEDPLFSIQWDKHTKWHDPIIKGKLRHNDNARLERNTQMGMPMMEEIE